jgi:hypothetical protein
VGERETKTKKNIYILSGGILRHKVMDSVLLVFGGIFCHKVKGICFSLLDEFIGGSFRQ